MRLTSGTLSPPKSFGPSHHAAPPSTSASTAATASLPPDPERVPTGPFSNSSVRSSVAPESGPLLHVTLTVASASTSSVTRIGTWSRSRPTGTS